MSDRAAGLQQEDIAKCKPALISYLARNLHGIIFLDLNRLKQQRQVLQSGLGQTERERSEVDRQIQVHISQNNLQLKFCTDWK